MGIDNRKNPRFNPRGLAASISIVPPPPDEEIILEGTVADMSCTGIRIKLNAAISPQITESEIKIKLNMPESGVPVSIHGIVKHLNDKSECGLQFSDKHPEHEIDDLIFECIKLADNHIQGVTL